MVVEKCEKKKIERKNERKEKGKEMNIKVCLFTVFLKLFLS